MDRPIFFSYRHDGQKEFVERFEQECRAHLLTTWRDDRVPVGESPEEHVERMLPHIDIVLLFLSESTYAGLSDSSSGLHREVKRLLERRAHDNYAIVLVDLEGYATEALATFPVIGGATASFTLRLIAAEAFSLFRAGANESKVRAAMSAPIAQIIARQRGVDVFPRAHATRAPGMYLLSAVGVSGQDRIAARVHLSGQEANEQVKRLPLRQVMGQQILSMLFEHHDGPDDYWAGVVALDSDDSEFVLGDTARRDAHGEWLPRDLTRMRKLELDMRVRDADRPLPVQVRLEDDSLEGRAGSSFHQSTSWNRRQLLVGSTFRRVTLDLEDDFGWAADSFEYNTQPPDRSRVLQLTFGHDHRVAAASGCLEIRGISLRPSSG